MSKTPPHLRRAARRLRLATAVATALLELVILFAAYVLVSNSAAAYPWLSVETGLPPVPTALALLLFGLLLGLAFLRLIRLLREVEAGLLFPARSLRGFARYLLLAVLVLVLSPTLLQLAGGARRLHLSLDERSALMLLVAGLLFFVARLLDEAQRLADDHGQIV